MVTEKKIANTALTYYRLGNVLIWLGVLTWLPFIVLRIAGEKPSLFLYLPFHLVGVVGGSRLRAFALRKMGASHPKRDRLRVMGHVLIYIGILVWVPYFYLKIAGSTAVDVMNFLPYHLTGVLSGITLLGISYLMSRKRNAKA